MANFFDQFDAQQQPPKPVGNFFDQFDAPQAQQQPAAAPAAPMRDLNNRTTVPPGSDALREMTYVGQKADRGIANVLGTPVDLSTAALNLGAYGMDKIAEMFGGNFDGRISEPFLGSDWIANHTASAYEGMGGDVVPAEEVSGPTRTLGTLVEGGVSAALPGMALASAPVQAASKGVRFFEPMAAPYKNIAGPVIARDAITGGTAAGGAEAYDRWAPEWLQDSMAGPLVKMLASMAGGIGGATAMQIGEGAAGGIKNAVRDAITGKADPYARNTGLTNPSTGQPYTRSEMDMAAQVAKTIPTSKAHTLDQLETDPYAFAPKGSQPTTGMQADDIGMSLYENRARTQDPKRFIERDTERRALASDKLGESAPRGADPRAFTTATQGQYDDTLNAARQGVDQATDDQTRNNVAVAQQQATLREFTNNQPVASARLHDEIDRRLDALMNEKNARFRSVPDETPIPGQPVREAIDEVHAGVPEMAQGGAYGQVRGQLDNRLRGEPVLDAEGNPVGETTRDLTYGDLRSARAGISQARTGEVTTGGSPEFLDRIGSVVNRQVDAANPDAAEFYQQTFVPQAKTGEMGEFYNARKRANKTGEQSAATAPSKTAERFLRTPEAASRLPALRGVENAPFPQNDATDWMLGEMAKADVLTPDGQLRYDRFSRWAGKNRAIIDQFPEMRARIDQELATAQQGGQLSTQLARAVVDARSNLRTTERDLGYSALAQTLGKEPTKAVGSILNGPDPQRHMAEIVQRLNGNPTAMEGLKASVRDWIKERVSNSGALLGHDDAAVMSQSKMDNLFRKHEQLLATIYSPEEMQALQQARKLLSVESSRNIRAGTGSDTIEKFNSGRDAAIQQRKRMLEAALKLKFGNLVGGGYNRAINVALSAFPDRDKALAELLFEMQFNPEVAIHLLKRPVKDLSQKDWNAKLNRWLSATAGAREANRDEGRR